MSLTQDASTGDTVIVVSCYVEGLKVGDFIALNGANYEVPPSPPPPSDDDGATNPLAPNASHCPPMCSTLAHLRRTADLYPPRRHR